MDWKARPRGEYVLAIVRILEQKWEISMRKEYCEFLDMCRDTGKTPATCAYGIVEGSWEQSLSGVKAAAVASATVKGTGKTSKKSAGRAGPKAKLKAKPVVPKRSSSSSRRSSRKNRGR